MIVVSSVDVTSLSYAERQLIVVAEDDLVAASRHAEAEERRRAALALRTEDGSIPEPAVTPVDYGKVVKDTLALIGAHTAHATEYVLSLLNPWAKAKQSGVRVLQVALSEAAKLRFPPGHPRQGVIYIGHPAAPNVYYTMAGFHRITFEHKFAEAVRLLTCLGARRLRVEHIKGWGREFSASMSVGLPTTDGADVKSKSEKKESLLFEAKLTGTTSPRIPDDLVWFPYESTWQMIAHSRFEAGLEEFSLNVVYEDDFGINAAFKGTIDGAGLDVGGRFEDHQSTIWRIAGDFRRLGDSAPGQ